MLPWQRPLGLTPCFTTVPFSRLRTLQAWTKIMIILLNLSSNYQISSILHCSHLLELQEKQPGPQGMVWGCPGWEDCRCNTAGRLLRTFITKFSYSSPNLSFGGKKKPFTKISFRTLLDRIWQFLTKVALRLLCSVHPSLRIWIWNFWIGWTKICPFWHHVPHNFYHFHATSN